jgi:hypothetical protein
MVPHDDFIRKLEPVIEWIAFRFRWLAVAAVVVICGFLVLFQWWAWLAVRGNSPLKGRVSVAGRPVTHGTVTALTSGGTVLSAQIQPDGSYEFPDVPPGPVQLAVSSPEPRSVFQKAFEGGSPPVLSDPSATSFGQKTKQSKTKDVDQNIAIALSVDSPPPSTNAESRPEHDRWLRIPGRYANPASSGLRANVEPSGANADLELTADD